MSNIKNEHILGNVKSSYIMHEVLAYLKDFGYSCYNLKGRYTKKQNSRGAE